MQSKLVSLHAWLAGCIDKLKARGLCTNDEILDNFMDCTNSLNIEKGQPCCSLNDHVREEAVGGFEERSEGQIINSVGDEAYYPVEKWCGRWIYV